MNYESVELSKYLHEIAERSCDGRIPWSQPNPSTFQWILDVDTEHFQVTIQKATPPRAKIPSIIPNIIPNNDEDVTFLFQVQDRRTRQTIMALSSAERPEMASVLGKIFYGAEKGIDHRSSSVLRKLLGKE